MKFVKRNKNILLCTPDTFPYNSGSGRNAYNYGYFLSCKGFNVTILCLNKNKCSKRVVSKSNFHFNYISFYNKNLLFKILSLISIIPGYIKNIIKNDVILIYGGQMPGFELIIFLGSLLRKKVIFRSTLIDVDDIDSLLKRNIILSKIRKVLLAKIDLYFSLNPRFTDISKKVYQTNLNVFESPQGVNLNMYKMVSTSEKERIREKLHFPKNTFIIIYVGYMLKRKGLCEVFDILSKIKYPFKFYLIGNYEVDLNHYQSKAREEMKEVYHYGKKVLKNKIEFIGYKYHVRRYLQASDVMILNSEKEGMPNALLEALACGTVPIIRNIEGIVDFIIKNHSNGLLYENGEELKKILYQLMENKDKLSRLAHNAATFAIKYLGYQNISQRLFEKLDIAK